MKPSQKRTDLQPEGSGKFDPPRRKRFLMAAGIVIVLLGAGASIGWASARVLTPLKNPIATEKYALARVTRGEVGFSIALNVAAQWSSTNVGTNLAGGTVTTVSAEPGQTLSTGATLYTVNLRPTVLAQGEIPAFEPLTLGARGEDVAQLQRFLATLGTYAGSPKGIFDRTTLSAVKVWQKSLGVAVDGIVRPGDVIYVPSLPARITLDPTKVFRGAQLSGGEQVVAALSSTPAFSLAVSAEQSSLIPKGTQVEISSGAASWKAIVGEQTVDADGGVTLILGGEGNSSICLDQCDQVPTVGRTLLPSKVITTKTVEGLVVPTSALTSDAAGKVFVVSDDGVRHSAKLLATAGGMSAISGPPEGLRVRVPATTDRTK
ncbi:peptidoglycan-binding protein [Glaciihabitans sp. INWT7]|uniref:peptidoglycan-binding domain-containing protein n=1 Tax=Glaciihabitans sp. INWT7 TaxID=2596912 RepID=UPI00162A6A60|nr:peptidoglycan-binding protein [Glaciihabitans sp. INWT7]QNE46132.1 peptidoglycan-binding protein [Glaciihabitans sp. INWT7]